MVKRQSEYSPVEWQQLFPEQRYLAAQAESDAKMGRAAIPVRAADGRGVTWIDPTTKQPVPAPSLQPRVMG